MNYWIFTVAPHRSDSESYTARQIYERRMEDRFWGIGARTDVYPAGTAHLSVGLKVTANGSRAFQPQGNP